MKIYTFIFFILLSVLFEGNAQERTFYHNFRTGDSHVVLTEWRVEFKNIGKYYIQERVDSLNRVTELRLMKGDSLYTSDCYNNAIYRFEYLKDKIVQHNLDNDSTYSAGIECGAPAKIIYYLSDGMIDSSVHFLDYDQYLNGNLKLEPDFRAHLEKEHEKNKDGIKGDSGFITGYMFSSVKFEGYLPVTKNVSLDNYFYPYSKEAKKSPFAIQNSTQLHKNKSN